MEKFTFAIVGHNHKDVVATLSVHAENMDEAKKKIRQDPDMHGVRFYPTKDGQKTGEVEVVEPISEVPGATATELQVAA